MASSWSKWCESEKSGNLWSHVVVATKTVIKKTKVLSFTRWNLLTFVDCGGYQDFWPMAAMLF